MKKCLLVTTVILFAVALNAQSKNAKLNKYHNTQNHKCVIEVTGVVTNVNCYGDNSGAIDISVTHTKGEVKYLWSDGSTAEDREGLAAGDYSVTVSDETKRTATASFTVTQPAEPLTVTAKTKAPSAPGECDGGAILEISGGNPLYSITWNDGSGSTSTCRNDLCPGTYKPCVTDANGCTVPVKVVVPEAKGSSIMAAVDASTILSKEKVSVSPNPTKGMVQLTLQAKTNGSAVVNVYDAAGKRLSTEKFGVTIGTNIKQLDLGKYSKGLYHIEMLVNGEKKVVKIMVQ